MWGAGWGVNGAAAATAISMAVGGLVFLWITFTRPSPIQIGLKQSYRLDFGLLKRISQIGLPAMFERVSNLTAGMIITATVAVLGTNALAANTLFNTATEITMKPAFALSAAATTMVGQFLGAKMPREQSAHVYRILAIPW
jgi:Na+-driven multidrug efflux pump